MSEVVDVPGGAPEGVAVHGMSAGMALRQAREAAGLHIGALAVALKVPVKKLEALEADDLTQLPDATFARALAASVCRTLKVDPEPILALLPQLEAPPLAVGSHGGGATFSTANAGAGAAMFSRLSRPVVYTTGALLLGAVVLLVLPAMRQLGGDIVPAPEGVAVRTVPNLQSGLPQLAASEPLAAASTPAEMAAAAPVTPASAPAASASAPAAAAAAAAASEPVAAEPTAVAVFRTSGPSWLQVVGADGVVHLRKTMGANETANVNGAMPLSVVVGRADAMEVLVRGKPLDLGPLARDNVARFQIK